MFSTCLLYVLITRLVGYNDLCSPGKYDHDDELMMMPSMMMRMMPLMMVIVMMMMVGHLRRILLVSCRRGAGGGFVLDKPDTILCYVTITKSMLAFVVENMYVL